MAEPRPLFRRFPSLSGNVPWFSLARLPTPVERWRVAEGEVALRVKRDDLTGGPYGGNKVRKLEFLLARARAEGAGRILTAGGEGSHHALATAIYAGQMGWSVTLVLSPQAESDHARKVHRAIQDTGARIHWVSRGEELVQGLHDAAWEHQADGPFTVPPGGSDAWGTLGYLNAALELDQQLEEGGMEWPERIYLPAGTLGTAAGLALGLELVGARSRIVGVRVVGRVVTNREVLDGLLQGATDLLTGHGAGLAEGLAERAGARVELREGYLGSGYGHPTEEGWEAAGIFHDAGLPLDPTYTAKAAAALLEDARREGGDILYWHTLSVETPWPAEAR